MRHFISMVSSALNNDLGPKPTDIEEGKYKSDAQRKAVHAAKNEAVGDSAEAFYELQDEFCGGECPSGAHKAIIDELVRYLSGDQIADFVADFRRNYNMDDMEETAKDPTSIDADSITESVYLNKVSKLLKG